jgi:hypothetical protein
VPCISVFSSINPCFCASPSFSENVSGSEETVIPSSSTHERTRVKKEKQIAQGKSVYHVKKIKLTIV